MGRRHTEELRNIPDNPKKVARPVGFAAEALTMTAFDGLINVLGRM
jgi:hypothetical protein